MGFYGRGLGTGDWDWGKTSLPASPGERLAICITYDTLPYFLLFWPDFPVTGKQLKIILAI